MAVKTVINAKLRGQLAYNGVKIKDLEEILGISKVAIYRKMKGQTDWKLEELKALALKLNCNIDDLVD